MDEELENKIKETFDKMKELENTLEEELNRFKIILEKMENGHV